MNLTEWKVMKLLDIATIDRAKANVVYQKGTILIQVSATKGQVIYLDKEMLVEGKYAVITCNQEIVIPKYLYYMLSRKMPEFLNKFQTDLNLQINVFKHMELNIHTDLKLQSKLIEILELMEQEQANEQRIIDSHKDLKKYCLDKMFC